MSLAAGNQVSDDDNADEYKTVCMFSDTDPKGTGINDLVIVYRENWM